MNTAILSSKYQISIPKQIRKQLHLKAGQQFIFIAKGEGLYLIPKRSINEVRGLMAGANSKNYRDRTDRV